MATPTPGRPAAPAAAPTPARARRPAAPPPTPARVALVSPWRDSTKWDEITIAGIAFTGKVTVSGEGLKTKKDHRSPRGRNGGRSVGLGRDLSEFTVTLSAFPSEDEGNEDLHVQQLDAIIARLSDDSPTRQDASAFPIAYPSLAALRVTQVTLESIDLPEYEAGSTLNVTMKFKTFKPSVPRATRTTAPAAENGTGPAANPGVNSITPIAAPPRRTPPSQSGAAAPRTP